MKILALIDNQGWCWQRTTENLAYHMPEHEWDLMTAAEFREIEQSSIKADLVYMRGYSNMFLRETDELPCPFIWTLSTGGANLAFRLKGALPTGRKAAAVIVQNQKAYHECVSAGLRGAIIIPNGVDGNLFSPTEVRKSFTVGFAGNNFGSRGELKGTGILHDALKLLQGVDYKETTYENPLPQQDMPDFYNSLSVYCQPSEAEGCSNSVMEAMSCGLPCLICEGVGYHGEVCRDGIDSEKGEVVFVKREPGDIAEKISILRDNVYIAERISRNARRFANEHSWKIIVEKFRALFDSLDPSKQKKAAAWNVAPPKKRYEGQMKVLNFTPRVRPVL